MGMFEEMARHLHEQTEAITLQWPNAMGQCAADTMLRTFHVKLNDERRVYQVVGYDGDTIYVIREDR